MIERKDREIGIEELKRRENIWVFKEDAQHPGWVTAHLGRATHSSQGGEDFYRPQSGKSPDFHSPCGVLGGGGGAKHIVIW